MPDVLIFSEERVLSECLEVVLTPSGFLRLVPDEGRFIDDVIVLDILCYTSGFSSHEGTGIATAVALLWSLPHNGTC